MTNIILIVAGVFGAFIYAILGFAVYHFMHNDEVKKCKRCNLTEDQRRRMAEEDPFDNWYCYRDHRTFPGSVGILWLPAGILAAAAAVVYGILWTAWKAVGLMFLAPNRMGKRLAGWVE